MIATSNVSPWGRLRAIAPTLLLLAWALATVIYFNRKVPLFWISGWTHDDLMNTYRAMETPYKQMLREIAAFWLPTPLFRPLGELLYKAGFDAWGWNPLPWRYTVFAILMVNALLLGHFTRRLSGSLAAGLLAMTICAYHPHWVHLYVNTGTLFEMLAFTFVWGVMALYIEADERGFATRPWLLAAVAILYILGLNCKESVIVVPVFLVLYELLVNRRIPWRLATLLGIISLAFILGRVYGPEGLSSVGSYKPTYNIATYLDRFRNYFAHLVLWTSIPLAGALGCALLPLLLRTRQACFVACVFPVGILPLAFVPDRGLDGVYVACAALAITTGLLIAALPKEPLRLAAATAGFLALIAWLPAIQGPEGWDREYKEIDSFHRSLVALVPQMPAGVQIRILSEPFTAEYPWASTFIARLSYRDPTLVVVSPSNPHTANFPESKDFLVFEWRSGMLVRIK